MNAGPVVDRVSSDDQGGDRGSRPGEESDEPGRFLSVVQARCPQYTALVSALAFTGCVSIKANDYNDLSSFTEVEPGTGEAERRVL